MLRRKSGQGKSKSISTSSRRAGRFQVEGLRLLFANNTFIFTQAAALENFAKNPYSLRSTVKQVTLRVVGRYYDEIAGKRDLTGNVDYHSSIDKLMMPIAARPPGMVKDKGLQAYCWEQLADFLRALLMPTPASVFRQKLLPHLEFMRIDLVNFCDHLPYGGYQFSSLVRWHLGRLVDEILITGAPEGMSPTRVSPARKEHFTNWCEMEA
jgi:hypothetical protein